MKAADTPKVLRLTLQSAATFGRGDGVAGSVDREVEHDADGFPFLRGRTLKGLLAEAAEDVLYALVLQGAGEWGTMRDRLFGLPGRGLGEGEQGILHVGDAGIPVVLRRLVLQSREEQRRAQARTDFSPEAVLAAFTGIRRQTAMSPRGAPERATLRAMRVVLRDVQLEAPLSFSRQPEGPELHLLVAAVLDLRRAGTGRNRGRGRLCAELDDKGTTHRLFDGFAREIAQ